MSLFPREVTGFTAPAFVGAGGIPYMIVNGQAVTQTGIQGNWDDDSDLAEMITLSGLSIPHHLPESAMAPTTTDKLEVSGTVTQPLENTRDAMDLANALTRGGNLSIWFDIPRYEIWISNGSATDLITSRPFGWATMLPHGVNSSNRPARAWLTNATPGNALTVIGSGTPAAGEILIPDTTDGVSVTLGAAPAAGILILVQAYFLRGGKFEIGHQREGLAGYEISFEFEESVPERSFE